MFTHRSLGKPVGYTGLVKPNDSCGRIRDGVLHLFTNARVCVFRPRTNANSIRIFHNEVRRPPRLFLQRLMELDTR